MPKKVLPRKSGAAETTDSETRRQTAPRVSAPEVIKTTEDAVRVLAERGSQMVGVPEKDPLPRPSRSAKRRTVEKGDGRCKAYSPRGTKCKLCGKVHP